MARLVSSALAVRLIASALTLAPGAAFAEEFINILTGGTSGVYYPLGVALSQVYEKALPDARIQVQSTKASVENLNLLQQGRGELAFALGDSVALAWAGDEEAGFRGKLDKLRNVAAVYPNYIQIVASKQAGINTLADLKGKSVSVGAPRSGTELNARATLSAAGVSYDDLGKVEYLPFAESVELMKNRQLDATLQSAGLGVASIRDLATTNDIVVVPVPAEIVAKIGAPYLPMTIPADTYRGQTDAVPTAAVINYLVTHEGVQEETVYRMVKHLFESKDQLIAAHQAAKDIALESAAAGTPVPFHPGAERYYKEKGVMK